MLPPPPPPAPPPPRAPRPAAPVSPAAPPRPQAAQREAPSPPPRAARPAAPASAAPPAPDAEPSPRINLGGTDSLSNVLVEGDHVIPAGPDPKVHNREPDYPAEAARRGQHGVVILLIQVSPEGLPNLVDIARSSGFDLLDRAAREAVETWHFVPAIRDGKPIRSTMSLRVKFELD